MISILDNVERVSTSCLYVTALKIRFEFAIFFSADSLSLSLLIFRKHRTREIYINCERARDKRIKLGSNCE